MDEAKFVIIGANGQLGTALREQYKNARAIDVNELDITNRDAVQAFDWSNVTVVLNGAAYTNVDGAESADGRVIAWSVNAIGPRNLAEVAGQHGITLIHISTDYVFDGSNVNHLENELFSPLSVYGQSKAAGDVAISLAPKYYILRTTWVIGEGKNFVRTMLDLGKKNISPTVVSDQIGRLTFTTELVRAIDHLLKNKPVYGTYNSTNEGRSMSWADITREIFKLAKFNLQVTDTTSSEYFANKPGIAPRPLKSTMDLSKLASTGFMFRDWLEDLKIYVEKELKK
jgi:dTDP-4-dehydrorhamnose 3,5-epimerase